MHWFKRRLNQRLGQRLVGAAALIACVIVFQNCGQFASNAGLANLSSRQGVNPDDPTPSRKEQILGAPPMRLLTNEEYYQSVSDLLGVRVDRKLMESWSASPQAYGFDQASSGNLDEKGLEDRLLIAETLSDLAIKSNQVMICKPDPREMSYPGCAQKIAETFARRAFRRSLSAEQRAELAKAFNSVTTKAISLQITEPIGYFDSIDGRMIAAGWAADPIWQDRTVEIHFYANGPAGVGQFVGTTIADQPRGDVNQVMNIIGDHGFYFQLPLSLADGAQHAIYAYAISAVSNPMLGTLRSPAVRNVNTVNLGLNQLSTPFQDGLRAVIQSVLLSPNFLFKSEVGVVRADGLRELDQFEIASRLSFMIAGTIPDEALSSLATLGMLNDPKVLRSEAERLLTLHDSRFAMNFFGQWFEFRRMAQQYTTKTPSNDTERLENAMVEESRLVFQQLVGGNYSFESILKPGFTWVDSRLASLYGMSGSFTPGTFKMVPARDRGGVLNQASVLRLTSNPMSTHPIRRGRWTLAALLCDKLPLPDPSLQEEINKSLDSMPPNLSISERLATHRGRSTTCLSCHMKMDPIGLGLENYDAFGAWRTKYADGKPVVSAGDLLGTKFSDGTGLGDALRALPTFRQCVVKKAMTYAFMRNVVDTDLPLVQRLADSSQTIRSLVLDLVTSESFRTIRPEDSL